MKKIKELFLLLCEAAVLMGHAGLLAYGIERYAKLGLVHCGVMFAIAFFAIYLLQKKRTED